MKRILYKSDFDYDEFIIDNLDYLQEYCDENDLSSIDEIPEQFIYDEMNFQAQINYDDEEACLSQIDIPNVIICLANIGRWNGRFDGYKIMSYDLSDCLQITAEGHDSFELYVDSYNLLGVGYHHDGTNSYEFRMLRDNFSVERFEDTFFYRGAKYARKMTKSLRPFIAKEYGWTKSKSAG